MNHNGISAETADGGVFGQSDSGQLGLTEYRTGNKVMIHLARTATELGIGKSPALIHRHRGEADAIGHISHSEDMGDRGALVSIHRQKTALLVEPGGLKIQSLKEWLAPCSQQNTAGMDPVSLIRHQNEIAG